MTFFELFIDNLITIPILAFIIGIVFGFLELRNPFDGRIKIWITSYLLFAIGLKGGASFLENFGYESCILLTVLIVWGLLQPVVSYTILTRCINIDSATAAAISACFGSVSVMTYVAGANFLEKSGIQYNGLVVTALAVMEVPAIISGLFIYQFHNKQTSFQNKRDLLLHSIFNKSLLLMFFGIFSGIVLHSLESKGVSKNILIFFQPTLAIFLLSMGYLVGCNRKSLSHFSLGLILFGICMPIVGASFGILTSLLLKLDQGTGTLIAVLTASASYIAVPAAMRVSLPEAKETIYLPLSLGVAFPFNVVIGIPLYYEIARKLI